MNMNPMGDVVNVVVNNFFVGHSVRLLVINNISCSIVLVACHGAIKLFNSFTTFIEEKRLNHRDICSQHESSHVCEY